MRYNELLSNKHDAVAILNRYFNGDKQEATHVARRLQSQYQVPPRWVSAFVEPRASWRDSLTWHVR